MSYETEKRYHVLITATAKAAIRNQVEYIAVNQQSPQNAAVWLSEISRHIEQLAFLPKRFPVADGYESLPYIVRRTIVGRQLILFTIDHTACRVYVVGLRNGARQPRPGDLPPETDV